MRNILFEKKKKKKKDKLKVKKIFKCIYRESIFCILKIIWFSKPIQIYFNIF